MVKGQDLKTVCLEGWSIPYVSTTEIATMNQILLNP